MNRTDGKTKSIGGLNDISECLSTKSDEQIAVEIVVFQNGKRRLISLNEFKALLFDEPKKVVKRTNNLEDSLNNKEYLKMYGKPMLEEFIDYWTEMNISGKKMRYQKERTFDISRRLKTWAKRDFNGNYREHKIQLEKTKQDEYLRRAKEEAYMTPEEQRAEFKKLTQGMFKGMNEEV